MSHLVSRSEVAPLGRGLTNGTVRRAGSGAGYNVDSPASNHTLFFLLAALLLLTLSLL